MMKFDVEVDWLINEYCNFECKYCFDQSNKKNKNAGYKDIQKIVDGFRHSGLTWLIHMSGGEPLFFPDFTDLCEMLTEKHLISINTNLSHKNIYAFAEKVPPEQVVFIHGSFHIQERERLSLINDYIDKCNMLKKKGFYVCSSYVLIPQLFYRYEMDYEYFKKEGIILIPKVYRGNYSIFKLSDNNKFKKLNELFIRKYPNDYSYKQKQTILKYIEKSQHDMKLIDVKTPNISESIWNDFKFEPQFLKGLPSFKGKICLAGKNFVRMTSNGDVFRCHDEKMFLGNLFERKLELLDKPIPCAAKICNCPYFGIRYSITNDGQRENNYI